MRPPVARSQSGDDPKGAMAIVPLLDIRLFDRDDRRAAYCRLVPRGIATPIPPSTLPPTPARETKHS